MKLRKKDFEVPKNFFVPTEELFDFLDSAVDDLILNNALALDHYPKG